MHFIQLLAAIIMKRITYILLLTLIFLSDISFGQDNSEINEVDIYICINDVFIPYLISKGDTNIQIGRNTVRTFFNTSIYDELYNETFRYLKNELSLDKEKVKHMKRQIRNENDNWKWEQYKIINANVNDSLRYYKGHHFSIPIISKDKNIFIIFEYSKGKPSGRCGTVHSYYTAIIFMKEKDKWVLLKTLKK